MGHPSKTRAETQKGNKNGTKLKDAKIRQEAYKAYCKHVEDGWPKQAFCFEKGEFSVSWATMDRYMSESPGEFDAQLMENARSKRYKHWFGEGNKLTKGMYKNGSPVTWSNIMRNMFKDVGWDQQEQDKGKFSTQQLEALAGFFDRVNGLQSRQPEAKEVSDKDHSD